MHPSRLFPFVLLLLSACSSDPQASPLLDDEGATGGTGNTTGGTNTGGSGGGVSGTGAVAGTGGGSGGSTPAEITGERVDVSTVEELRAALSAAQAGDQILLAPGNYSAPDASSIDFAGALRLVYFGSEASGTAEAPIIVESADANQPATLEGLGTTDSGYLLWIHGEHWIVRNLAFDTAGKGIMLDDASHSVLSGVEVRNIGDEGIHLRSGTSNVLVENCVVDGTGLEQPGFGEGIYVGSDRSTWDAYEPMCTDNVIRGCTIRDTAAEAIDVKEGTTGTIIEDCSIYGGSISGENFADSFVDLKGDGARVRDNTLYKEGNATVTRGVAIVDRTNDFVTVSSRYNWIYDNTFEMDDAEGLMVHAYRGLDNYAWSNSRDPAGEEYNGNDPELYFDDPR